MKTNKQNNKQNNSNIGITIDANININVNRNKNIDKNIAKNPVLSKLSSNPKSINDVINIIDDNNFPSTENLYNELLKFDIHELLSIKANLEKADKVNFLVDEVKWLPIDKDITEQTTNLIIVVLALTSVLISLKETQKLEFLKYAIVYSGVFFFVLVILMIVFKNVKNSYPSKPTDNKYKVFQYLVDIAIEKKKKELN